jgi:hypothetical protein
VGLSPPLLKIEKRLENCLPLQNNFAYVGAAFHQGMPRGAAAV